MNERGGKRSKPGDRKNKARSEASDAAVVEVVKAIDAGLAGFEQHKKELLDELSKVYERGPKSQPFDPEKAWQSLTFIAQAYFHRETVKKRVMKRAARKTNLHQLATALRRAREKITDALHSDIAND